MTPPRADVKVLGTRLGALDHALRDFLTRIDQDFEWLDLELDLAAGEVVDRLGLDAERLPIVVIENETALASPALAEVADALGIRYPPSRREYDLVIAGAGPAGLAAAVYAASDGLRTVVAERAAPGGQASYTSRIENYFGLDPQAPAMSGAHLARIGGRQAEFFGAELLILRAVTDRALTADGRHVVILETGEELVADAVLCASGVDWRRLEAPGLEELVGSGVYYGAGRSEAPSCRGERVFIVGAGNSAGQAALYFAEYAERVTMVVRGRALGATLSAYLAERIDRHPAIEVRLETRLSAVHGDRRLREITLADAGGRERRERADALFIAIGGAPRTEWAEDSPIVRDRAGYLITGPDLLAHGAPPPEWPLERQPLTLETTLPGFFVAGDVRLGSTKRVASAVGEGAMATALVHRYLEERRGAVDPAAR